MQASKAHRTATLVILGLLLLPAAARAQYAKDQKFLGAHVGMSGVGSTAAFGVNGEVAYNEHIGIGGWADTWSYGDSYSYLGGSYSWNVRYVALAGTGAYHFTIKSNRKVDPFAGAALGYYIVSTSANADGPAGATYQGSANRMFVGGYGGVRYFFKPSLSGVARAGFGASYLTLGLDWKL